MCPGSPTVGNEQTTPAKVETALVLYDGVCGLCKVTAVLRILLARVRDLVYDMVARHRYRIFGRYDTCPLPEARYRDRFIDLS